MGMPLDFDLKHAVYGGAGAAVGAIVGYLLGIVLYVVVVAANAIAQSSTVPNAGIFPLLFAITFAALGFFGGFYISSKASEPKPAA
jgi:ABC-type transport system involved in multi-copper enzyme maturation permease subunit